MNQARDPASVQGTLVHDGPLRIGLFGEFGIGNIGNDASLAAAVSMLHDRLPDAELVSLCRDAKAVRSGFGIKALGIRSKSAEDVRPSWLPGAARKALAKGLDAGHLYSVLSGFDLIIVPGTGILEQFGVRPSNVPLTLFLFGSFARIRKIPVAWISVGAEPSLHPASRLLMRWALAPAAYRSYRDELTRASVAGLGIAVARDEIYPDLVFGSDVEITDSTRDPDPDREVTIGVGVMGYYGANHDESKRDNAHARYLTSLTAYLQDLLRRGYRVRLMTADGADVSTAVAIRASLQGSHSSQVHYRPSSTLTELNNEIAPCDVVVATRYHNLIAALKQNKPSVSLGYAPKNRALMADLGYDELCQEISEIGTIDLALLLSQTDKALADSGEISLRLEQANAEYRQRLLAQQRRIEERILR